MAQILSQSAATQSLGGLLKLTTSPTRRLRAKSDNPMADCHQPSAAKRVRMRAVWPLSAVFVLCVVFSIPQSAVGQSTFTNPTRIDGNYVVFTDVTPASPYPSNIDVWGLPGLVTKVTVTLKDLVFNSPTEADILLVGPRGQSVILMSDATIYDLMTLTFDDAALSSLPALTSGSYKPTNFGSEDDLFSYPAPLKPYGSTLSVFNATNPNGTWSLYMVDDNDAPWDYGQEIIFGGWSLTITTSTQVNQIDDPQFFVRQHYLDFLNREPDQAGYAGWQAILTYCPVGDTSCDRIHVSSAFFRSPEFQGRGYFVYRFYPVAFGRKPDFNEFTSDLAKVSGFLTDAELEAAKLAFTTEFMNRPAFVTRFNGLDNTQYVDTLLSTAGITHSNRDSWIAALTNGSRTRAQVLREIAESTEVYNKYYNQAFVVMQYFGYLRRQPDALYLKWIAHLDATGDYRSMINGFMNSIEYRARFGP